MRLYYGTYGHRLSGKLYVYWGDDNLRTGEQVLAPVTGKSGKTYNTMFTIARSQNVRNAEGEVDRLEDKGIFIKTILGRGTMSLPGAKDYETKTSWKRDSDQLYEAEKRKRLGLPSVEDEDKISDKKPKEPSKHAVNSQYVNKIKQEQNQLTKAIRRLGQDKAETKNTANENARTALKQRKNVSNTVKQRQRLINTRRR